MDNIEAEFDLNGDITLNFRGQKIKKQINLTTVNQYSKMAHIEYIFQDNWKWSIEYYVSNGKTQFININEYFLIDESKYPPKFTSGINPWRPLAEWSYNSKPTPGTIQTDKIYNKVFNHTYFPSVKKIKIIVKNSPYGDWEALKNY